MTAINTALFLFALMVALLGATTEAFVAPTPFFVKAIPQSSSSYSALEMTILTYGNKKKDFPPGSPLSRACAQLGVQVKYSCKKYAKIMKFHILQQDQDIGQKSLLQDVQN
jgi:hypothetical protein